MVHRAATNWKLRQAAHPATVPSAIPPFWSCCRSAAAPTEEPARRLVSPAPPQCHSPTGSMPSHLGAADAHSRQRQGRASSSRRLERPASRRRGGGAHIADAQPHQRCSHRGCGSWRGALLGRRRRRRPCYNIHLQPRPRRMIRTPCIRARRSDVNHQLYKLLRKHPGILPPAHTVIRCITPHHPAPSANSSIWKLTVARGVRTASSMLLSSCCHSDHYSIQVPARADSEQRSQVAGVQAS